MNNVKTIRERLGLTQAILAEGMGCTQGNVGHYEQGQTVPPDAARRLIAFAKTKGCELTFDDIYGDPSIAPQSQTEQVAPKSPTQTNSDASIADSVQPVLVLDRKPAGRVA